MLNEVCHYFKLIVLTITTRRSTQRKQTSLAEADHYPHLFLDQAGGFVAACQYAFVVKASESVCLHLDHAAAGIEIFAHLLI